MTQMWREDGTRIPVTVVDLGPNTVTDVRTTDRHGYESVQLGYGSVPERLCPKPQKGQFEKSGITEPLRHLREVRCESTEMTVGDVITVEQVFEAGQRVDVVGTSKGKGFAGTIKRHGFAQGPMSHGSQSHRRGGSIGMCKYPGRVLPGKKMAGRMGTDRVTVRGLEVLGVLEGEHQLLIKGPVPGSNGSLVMVSRSLKDGGG